MVQNIIKIANNIVQIIKNLVEIVYKVAKFAKNCVKTFKDPEIIKIMNNCLKCL